MVQKEQFREESLYRINTIHVEIPSLRERPEDIVPLTEIFLAKYCNIYGKSSMRLSADAKDKLKQQPWFGNIRELEHTIEKGRDYFRRRNPRQLRLRLPRKRIAAERGNHAGRDGVQHD